MKLFFSDHHPLPLPAGHRFPIDKYARLRQRIASSNLFHPEDLHSAPAAEDEQLLLVHLPEYLNKIINGTLNEKEQRRLGFPWSPGLVERSRRSVGATIEACRFALQEGIAANLAGGTHHAYPDHGEGYCVFNDVAVAARLMQAERRLARLLILDCDVHQGNGTAAIFAGDPTVYTFSIHGAHNFPFHKETGDLDIALPDGCGDETYLLALRDGLAQAVPAAQADLVIYIAGADPYKDDRLGRMSLTKTGLADRDRLVFSTCQAAGLPVAVTLGGGYAREIEDIVEINFQTLSVARNLLNTTV